MGLYTVFLALCCMSEAQRKRVFLSTLVEYAEVLSSIYNDIYESCIKVYYSSYPQPVRYKRHGDIVGFNLYTGFYSEVRNLKLDANYIPENLLPYRGSTSREEVLDAVKNGQRGTIPRVTKHGTWPQSWRVKYPNAYSQYSIWKSGGDTIETILEDFDKNGIEGTKNIFYDLLAKHI